MHTISEVIYKIIHDYGVNSLLDSKFVLAVFADLAPNLNKERELLKDFLSCGGAEKILGAVNKTEEIQILHVQQIVKALEEQRWISKQAAQYVCVEVYKGITSKELKVNLPDEKNGVVVQSEEREKTTKSPVAILTFVILLLVGVCLIALNKKAPSNETNESGRITTTIQAPAATEPSDTSKTTVYSATSYIDEPLEYFILNADKQYFDKQYFENFSAEDCLIARNGVYAISGRKFQSEFLRNYFLNCDWYVPRIEPEDFSDSMLNQYQKANIDLIVEYEKEKGYW